MNVQSLSSLACLPGPSVCFYT